MGYRDIFFKDKKNKSNHGWFRCTSCGKGLRKKEATIDHILPQSMGGGHDVHNLQVMCKHCNSSKGNSMIDSFRHYVENSARRDPPSKRSISSLDKALNSGKRKDLNNWINDIDIESGCGTMAITSVAIKAGIKFLAKEIGKTAVSIAVQSAAQSAVSFVGSKIDNSINSKNNQKTSEPLKIEYVANENKHHKKKWFKRKK